jgi:hypothetical protein
MQDINEKLSKETEILKKDRTETNKQTRMKRSITQNTEWKASPMEEIKWKTECQGLNTRLMNCQIKIVIRSKTRI